REEVTGYDSLPQAPVARPGLLFCCPVSAAESGLVITTVRLFCVRMPRKLTLATFKTEAATFARLQSARFEPALYAVTDGKAVGTHVEHAFVAYLRERYSFPDGNSAKGIDFPGLDVDIK